ncbi:AP-4 complex accessory subunit Tepsin [Gryganskiella cystojenkinii]|nr:AP-4 complex accessory subunit Tepsin [Gryganskiella cystojenkinii]
MLTHEPSPLALEYPSAGPCFEHERPSSTNFLVDLQDQGEPELGEPDPSAAWSSQNTQHTNGSSRGDILPAALRRSIELAENEILGYKGSGDGGGESVGVGCNPGHSFSIKASSRQQEYQTCPLIFLPETYAFQDADRSGSSAPFGNPKNRFESSPLLPPPQQALDPKHITESNTTPHFCLLYSAVDQSSYSSDDSHDPNHHDSVKGAIDQSPALHHQSHYAHSDAEEISAAQETNRDHSDNNTHSSDSPATTESYSVPFSSTGCEGFPMQESVTNRHHRQDKYHDLYHHYHQSIDIEENSPIAKEHETPIGSQEDGQQQQDQQSPQEFALFNPYMSQNSVEPWHISTPSSARSGSQILSREVHQYGQPPGPPPFRAVTMGPLQQFTHDIPLYEFENVDISSSQYAGMHQAGRGSSSTNPPVGAGVGVGEGYFAIALQDLLSSSLSSSKLESHCEIGRRVAHPKYGGSWNEQRVQEERQKRIRLVVPAISPSAKNRGLQWRPELTSFYSGRSLSTGGRSSTPSSRQSRQSQQSWSSTSTGSSKNLIPKGPFLTGSANTNRLRYGRYEHRRRVRLDPMMLYAVNFNQPPFGPFVASSVSSASATPAESERVFGMDHYAEAVANETTKSTINSIRTHALLSKALTNDSKPTPGYLFPEIARLTQTPGTSSAVLAQLLKVITPNGYNNATTGASSSGTSGSSASNYVFSPHVLLKALKILRQLAQSGSVEFRSSLARRGKGLVAEAVTYRGSWDEIHGDRLNDNIRTAAEDLIEYMHANPVQEPEEEPRSESFTPQESAVLKSATQGLQGFGNPEYEDSDSDDSDSMGSRTGRRKKKPSIRAPPPLPGFGNPAFEDDSTPSEPTLMTRLVDRLQEMTAPPPPMAMQAAYRQQEQRRQKLFVGEYSMRDDSTMDGLKRPPKEGSITIMGTNPFRRTTRTIGMAAGGWSDKKTDNVSRPDEAVSRMFPLYRSGTGTIRFRNSTSESVYHLAQNLQTNVVRSKLDRDSSSTRPGSGSTASLWDPPMASSGESKDRHPFAIWGTSKDLCQIILDGLEQEKSTVIDQGSTSAEKKPSSATPSVSVMTGLLRDLTEWIEYEDWERRLVRTLTTM